MRAKILAACAAIVCAACGSDGGGDGGSAVGSCNALVQAVSACASERGFPMKPAEATFFRSTCAEVLPAERAASCAACAQAAPCDLLDLCLDSDAICGEPRHELDVRGSGFTAHESARVRVLSFFALNDGEMWSDRADDATIASGAFEVTLHDALVHGRAHDIGVWVDSDGDGRCSTSRDLVFRQRLAGAAGGDDTVRITPRSTDTEDEYLCDEFDYVPPTLFVEGTGAGAGAWAILAIGEPPLDAMQVQMARVSGGRFAARFDWAQSREIEIAWMIDDGDFRCEAGTDRAGVATIAYDGLQPRLTLDTRQAAANGCDAFWFLEDPNAESL